MKIIQEHAGLNEPITPRYNWVRAEFFEKRINELFPSMNFFFFKIFYGDSEQVRRRNAIERRELQRLIETHMRYDRVYIKEGQIEPQYLNEDERKLLTEGMETSIEKINYEVYKSIGLT